MRPNKFSDHWRTAAVVLVALALPLVLGPSGMTTAVFVVIAAIAVTGLNVLTGFTGQVSLGHAFFLAAGAYSGVMLAQAGLPAALWILGGGVVAALLGAVIGPVALRLSGLYLAIVTLGLVFLGQHILFNATWLSGGPMGRAFPPVVVGPVDFATSAVVVGPLRLERNGLYFYLAVAILGAATLYSRNLLRTRPGRAMLSVRERPAAAAVMGVNVARTKIVAFAVSSFLTGIGGALYASFVGFAQPGHWDVLLSIEYVAAIVIGGMGTVAGPLLGAVVVFALPSILRTMPFLDDAAAGGVPTGLVATILYGVLIISFLVAEPRGLVGLLERIGEAIRRWPWRSSRAGTGTTGSSASDTAATQTPEPPVLATQEEHQ